MGENEEEFTYYLNVRFKTRMAAGVDVGKFIQGLQQKMNAKRNPVPLSEDESFYDAQSQFGEESQSER